MSDQALAGMSAADVSHLLAYDGDTLVGYAQLDGRSAEIVGDTESISALLDVSESSGSHARVWSHGRRSPLGAILAARGYDRRRELHQLRRALDQPLPDASVADGVTVRAFEPGRDEQAWLQVNAAAFADHAEQGRWTRADLEAREAEAWFDPAGFLVAERAGRMIGFHWTKIHTDGSGEVYVLGVDPSAQGLHLGTALLVRGLDHLARRGCARVLLYVDGDNAPALRLYERIGFTSYDVDTQWEPRQRPDTPQFSCVSSRSQPTDM